MKLFRYDNFSKDLKINENLDQAKKLLRDTFKLNKAAQAVSDKLKTDTSGLFLFNAKGDNVNFTDLPEDVQSNARQKLRDIKISPDETRNVERSQLIGKVRELLGDKLGYAYMFTYFLLIEKVPYDELKDILNKLVEYKDLLGTKNPLTNENLLRRPISNYIDPSVSNNSENLIDDLENIALYKASRKIYNELTPDLKKDYDEQPPVIKKQVEELALAFNKLGFEGGKMNKEVHERLWKLFFGEVKVVDGKQIYAGQMRRFKNIREFIKSAQNYLKSIGNDDTLKFYETIEKCNNMYGSYGSQVVFDENNILILEIKSFQANQLLNSHTRHCIKDSLYQWDAYVGGETLFTKQYYIYNFNLPSYDTKSVIGITIEPGQRIRACHLKDDGGYTSNIKSTLASWEKEYDIKEDLWSKLAPMDAKEIDEKKRRIVANKEIVKKDLTIEQIKKYLVEDGADVNAGKGQALDNAISDGNIEKVKFLLEFGASPNLRSRQEASVNKIQNIEDSTVGFNILKLLLNYGAELTPSVFKPLVYDYDAVKFCLDNGLKPDFEDNLPIRLSIKKGQLDVVKLLVKHGAKIDCSRGLPIAWAYEGDHIDLVNWLVDNGHAAYFDRSMSWIGHSPKIADKGLRVKYLKQMQKMIDDGRVDVCKTGYRIITKSGSINRNATLDQVIAEYGNLYNWCMADEDLSKK